MQAMESQFDVCTEDLFNQTIKLEEMEKKAGNAEGEVSSLRGRLILLQENNEKQEERLAKATLELAGACQRADASVRKRIELENGVSSNEETIDNLDKQLAESKVTLSDSENKFDDISRKLATLEADATRGNERAEGAEKKIADIEEELRVVGANMQQLEIGEEKTIAREEASQNEILELLYKLKRSEYRGEQNRRKSNLNPWRTNRKWPPSNRRRRRPFLQSKRNRFPRRPRSKNPSPNPSPSSKPVGKNWRRKFGNEFSGIVLIMMALYLSWCELNGYAKNGKKLLHRTQ